MTEDVSWAGLMMKIDGAGIVIRSEANLVLKQAANKVKQTAVEKFGSYQPSYGPFNAWALLNYDYVVEKVAAGSAGDNPLIGAYFNNHKHVWDTPLKSSLGTKLYPAELRAEIGTDNPLGLWHEYGTANRKTYLPPRPFLRPALYQSQDWIVKSMETAIGVGLVSWFK